jgi:signal transduction histidine kinase
VDVGEDGLDGIKLRFHQWAQINRSAGKSHPIRGLAGGGVDFFIVARGNLLTVYFSFPNCYWRGVNGRREMKMSSEAPEKKSGAAASQPAVVADLQASLQRLDQLANLGLVAANVAHEIKNGLVAINTFVELLLEKSADKEMAGVVQRELKRIDNLVTQMLRLSAPRTAEVKTVRLHDLLDHSLRLLEHQMKTRLLTLKRNYRAPSDAVRGDESQLQQALINLLLNATEAMGSNGELTVATEIITDPDGRRRLKIFIRDTGPGIAPENLSRLFEPFFTTKKNGTGLGLAICRRVVQEHQGSIEVESQDGNGSTFIITLRAE